MVSLRDLYKGQPDSSEAREESVVDQSVVEETIMDQSVVEESAVDQFVVDQPTLEEFAVDQFVADQPIVEETAVDQFVTDQSIVVETAVDQFVADQPVVKESVEDQTIVNQPLDQLPSFDPNVDPKKLRRMIANREAAKRSRIKQANRILSLEKQVKEMEAANWNTQSILENVQAEKALLKEENNSLKEKKITMDIQNAARDYIAKQLTLEKERLEQLMMIQELYDDGSSTSADGSGSTFGGPF